MVAVNVIVDNMLFALQMCILGNTKNCDIPEFVSGALFTFLGVDFRWVPRVCARA